ncbi:hypothetical protein CFOL_v3_09095 [Cephalotus follicularis]|uniref:Uncharacterized protein n=1 Tax=Cephalotus follicularis TaxID=3775 RepID=A0A1Q3BC61_CEPFO|nr:hypothetical protein CFOL_v3_09095 [Cephalotus follicularis]
MRAFNMAMLSKQPWRLATATDFLFYRTLKGKYFKDGGNNPSYTWRSIMAAQNIIKFGMKWRVGDGKSIKLWRHKWILGRIGSQTEQAQTILPRDAKVVRVLFIKQL